MSTQIILYPNCKILPWKNFSVDDLGSYLNTLTPNKNFATSQYIKHAIELTYKVDLTTTELDFNTLAMHNYNYLMAQNDTGALLGGIKVYYFIMNKKWISSTCIEFSLKMDTINTFKSLDISDKSTILRQHKNRWKAGTDQGLYAPVIDLYEEGIPTTLFKKEEHTLYETIQDGTIQGSFYLIYRNREVPSDSSPNPAVDILLCGDSPIPVNISSLGGYSGLVKWNDLDTRATYGGDLIIYRDDTPANLLTRVKFDVYTSRAVKETQTFSLDGTHNAIFLSAKYVAIGNISSSGFVATSYIRYNWWFNREFNDFVFTNLKCARQVPSSASLSTLTPTYVSGLHKMSMIENYLGNNGTISAITDVDRTDPKLLKIIKLPYRPVPYTMNHNGEMQQLPDGWKFEDTFSDFPNMLRYTGGTTSALINDMFLQPEEDDTYISPFIIAGNTEIREMATDLVAKKMKYETKLLHSDYYLAKFVYDSFTYDYKLEYINTDDLTGMNLWVDFGVSLTMSSKFMFVQTAYLSVMELDMQDYSGLVYVARNNELPIFNSEYISYIKAGYNYDIKTRNRQLNSNILYGVLQVGGAVVSAVAGVASGNPLGVAGAVGLGTSAVMTFTKTAVQTAQADQNIAQKLKEKEMQGVSVAGADDVDLMSYYTNDNKAKIVIYEVSERMKKCMYDLFYYCGYVANYQGVPDTTSRVLFNFVQAEIILNSTPNLPKEIVDDIMSKYREGITFIHHYTNLIYVPSPGQQQVVSGWDFEQQYENWESNI